MRGLKLVVELLGEREVVETAKRLGSLPKHWENPSGVPEGSKTMGPQNLHV